MIGSTRQVTVWAYGVPADLRKGFDGLSGLLALQNASALGDENDTYGGIGRNRALPKFTPRGRPAAAHW